MKPTNFHNEFDLSQIASALGVTEVSAFLSGVEDGLHQASQPVATVMFDEPALQWEYATGCHVGACLALRKPALQSSFYLASGDLLH